MSDGKRIFRNDFSKEMRKQVPIESDDAQKGANKVKNEVFVNINKGQVVKGMIRKRDTSRRKLAAFDESKYRSKLSTIQESVDSDRTLVSTIENEINERNRTLTPENIDILSMATIKPKAKTNLANEKYDEIIDYTWENIRSKFNASKKTTKPKQNDNFQISRIDTLPFTAYQDPQLIRVPSEISSSDVDTDDSAQSYDQNIQLNFEEEDIRTGDPTTIPTSSSFFDLNLEPDGFGQHSTIRSSSNEDFSAHFQQFAQSLASSSPQRPSKLPSVQPAPQQQAPSFFPETERIRRALSQLNYELDNLNNLPEPKTPINSKLPPPLPRRGQISESERVQIALTQLNNELDNMMVTQNPQTTIDNHLRTLMAQRRKAENETDRIQRALDQLKEELDRLKALDANNNNPNLPSNNPPTNVNTSPNTAQAAPIPTNPTPQTVPSTPKTPSIRPSSTQPAIATNTPTTTNATSVISTNATNPATVAAPVTPVVIVRPPTPPKVSLKPHFRPYDPNDREIEMHELINDEKHHFAVPLTEAATENLQNIKMGLQIRTINGMQELYVRGSYPVQPFTHDRLQYIRYIGSGSFGSAFLIKENNQRIIASVKVMRKGFANLSKVTDEVSMLSYLKHPYIVRFIVCCEDLRAVYLFTEYLPMPMLDELCAYTNFAPVSRRKFSFIAAQILLALEYLHSIWLLHRDIKPENIGINVHGYIKLIDFGMAKLVSDFETTTTFCGTECKFFGNFFGIFLLGFVFSGYMAPEILLFEPYGHPVDIYAFGMTMLYLAMGRHPFDGVRKVLVKYKIRTADIDIEPGLEHDIREFIMLAIEKDTRKRARAYQLLTHRLFVDIDMRALLLQQYDMEDILEISMQELYNLNLAIKDNQQLHRLRATDRLEFSSPFSFVNYVNSRPSAPPRPPPPPPQRAAPPPPPRRAAPPPPPPRAPPGF